MKRETKSLAITTLGGIAGLLWTSVTAELAAGTGGTYFHRSNDLEGGLRPLAAVPEYVYLLEMSLENAKKAK